MRYTHSSTAFILTVVCLSLWGAAEVEAKCPAQQDWLGQWRFSTLVDYSNKEAWVGKNAFFELTIAEVDGDLIATVANVGYSPNVVLKPEQVYVGAGKLKLTCEKGNLTVRVKNKRDMAAMYFYFTLSKGELVGNWWYAMPTWDKHEAYGYVKGKRGQGAPILFDKKAVEKMPCDVRCAFTSGLGKMEFEGGEVVVGPFLGNGVMMCTEYCEGETK